jgi:Glycosyl hydrolase family 63 C-terminal domain
MPEPDRHDPETARLLEADRRATNWKRWGPYLSERQWSTVREDYSADGDSWDYFPHDHARSRAYRWGEDGLLGVCDREGRLCFALALWNERDPILKERLYGLTNREGNHGEDVKEEYFYLDATPTASYLKGLYKYPHAEFPYEHLVAENRWRSRAEPEFELRDTGAFHESRYFDVFAEYAKAGPDDLLIRLTAANRGPGPARLHLLPTLWFRNTWSWRCTHEGCWPKPRLGAVGPGVVRTEHAALEPFLFTAGPGPGGATPPLLFTDNETNLARLFGVPNVTPYVKDAFHDYVVGGRKDAVSPDPHGTKVAAHYVLDLPPGGSAAVRLRLCREADASVTPFEGFDDLFARRLAEADEFYRRRIPQGPPAEQQRLSRLAYAGLIWSKQFYHYAVQPWLNGDPGQPRPPASRRNGRNHDWTHLFNRDVLSMPDKWEYPWFAAWDLAFHLVALARVDPFSAKHQLLLLLREWYMHPNGQLPAYEFDFGDANPPVHAWAAWRIYKIAAARGCRDLAFLERAFQKLLLNFTWWVNRKDARGKHLFAGGFLGLDNIGVFDRSRPLPGGGSLEQADGTAWMAFYCTTMLAIAFELARHNPAYEDIASKFFEHFIAIVDAMNSLGGTGLWDEEDGFYYDQLRVDGRPPQPLRVRSMVGLIPLIAVEVIEQDVVSQMPGFLKRARWLLANRKDLARYVAYMATGGDRPHEHRLLAIPSRDRLERVLRRMLDEGEFLSPHGLRSLSRGHRDHPYVFRCDGVEQRVAYVPGESDSTMFGGNSNWRGPVWFPVNYLIVEALERYHHFYGDTLQVECPTGSGRKMNLGAVARELAARLVRLFLPDGSGRRPSQGPPAGLEHDPHWRDLVVFHEYFDGDTGRGLGASHQTGWTALVARLIEDNVCPGEGAPALPSVGLAEGEHRHALVQEPQ